MLMSLMKKFNAEKLKALRQLNVFDEQALEKFVKHLYNNLYVVKGLTKS